MVFELGYIFFQFGFRSIFIHEFDMFSSGKFPKIGPFLQYIVLFDLFDKFAHKPFFCKMSMHRLIQNIHCFSTRRPAASEIMDPPLITGRNEVGPR